MELYGSPERRYVILELTVEESTALILFSALLASRLLLLVSPMSSSNSKDLGLPPNDMVGNNPDLLLNSLLKLKKQVINYNFQQLKINILWSFLAGGTKLERFLPKNQHTQRKLLNFENRVNGEVSKIGHHEENKVI